MFRFFVKLRKTDLHFDSHEEQIHIQESRGAACYCHGAFTKTAFERSHFSGSVGIVKMTGGLQIHFHELQAHAAHDVYFKSDH